MESKFGIGTIDLSDFPRFVRPNEKPGEASVKLAKELKRRAKELREEEMAKKCEEERQQKEKVTELLKTVWPEDLCVRSIIVSKTGGVLRGRSRRPRPKWHLRRSASDHHG